MDDLYVPRRFLHQMPETLAAAWRAWLDRHGITNHDPLLGGFIIRDVEARQVRYLRARVDPDGAPVTTHPGFRTLTEVAVVQLEAAPAPFPDEDDQCAPSATAL